MAHLLIDSDLILYRASFACQSARWSAVAPGTDEVLFEADNKRTLLDLIKKAGGSPEKLDLKKELDLKPVSTLHKIIDQTLNTIAKKTEASSWSLLLSDSRCHRHDIATSKPYKGGRADKPIHYLEAKRYLIQKYGAKIVDGGEADDAVSIAQQAALEDGDVTIVVSYDKDLLQIPGIHFDFKEEEWHRVSYLDGQRLLFQQILTGDPTDNFAGLPRVGPKSKYVKAVQEAETVQEMRDVVIGAYREFGESGKIEDWEDYLWEQANLAYILEAPDTMLNVNLEVVDATMKDFDENHERRIPEEPQENVPVESSPKSKAVIPFLGFRPTSRLSY